MLTNKIFTTIKVSQNFIRSLCNLSNRRKSNPYFLATCHREFLEKNVSNTNASTSRSVSSQELSSTFGVEAEMKNFVAFYPEVKQRILDTFPVETAIANQFEKFLDHMLPHGRQYRPTVMMKLFYAIAPDDVKNTITTSELYTVGWIIEMLQMTYLLTEDIQDGLETRRGRTCWYKVEPQTSQNDMHLLYVIAFKLLERVTGNATYYDNLNRMFDEVSFRMQVSHAMDFQGQELPKIHDVQEYYFTMATFKSDYTQRLPTNTALYLAGYKELPYADTLEKIYLNFGYFNQMMNDYRDLSGSFNDNGKKKSNEDIRRGVITWYLTRALKDGSEGQKRIIQDHYGNDNDKSVKLICDLYADLELMSKHREEELSVRKTLKNDINLIPKEILKNYFLKLLKEAEVYKQENL